MFSSFIGICATPTGGGGCPAAGSILRYETVIYPISEGGAYVTIDGEPGFNDADYPSQSCDIAVKADGSCGEYQDFSTATNVQYLSAGTFIAQSFEGTNIPRPEPMELNCMDLIPSLGGPYSYPGYYYTQALLDGFGSFYYAAGPYTYYSYGTQACSDGIFVNGPGCDPDNQIYIMVYWDGTGGWYWENY
jgi:hypothetical protein